MHAIIAAHAGGPEVLQLKKVPRVEPRPGQLRIRVEAASVNYSDVMRRRASPYPFETTFPYTPGSEVAGVVDAVGEGVDVERVGQRVFALVGPSGETGYAEYALAEAARATPIPGDLSSEAACGMLVAGVSAQLILTQANLQAGERIYIPAAAGAVGIAAVQIAKQRGAEVVAVSSTRGKRALTRTFGADETLDYTEQTKPCDVVLSMRGGALDEDIQRLAPFGRMVVYGAASTEPRSLSPACLAYLFDKPSLGQSITAFNLGAYFGLRQEQVGAAIGHVVQAYAKSSLQPCIGSILPLAAAPLIHRRLESRQCVGKAILQPTGDAQFNDDTVYASRLCRFDRHEDTMAFVWREETASMTLSDFQREMKRFGEMVAIHQTPHLFVDLRNFQYRGDTIPEQWRVQEVLPLYARGGASKMAFTASGHRGQDIQHDFGLKEQWFDRAADAEAWLAS